MALIQGKVVYDGNRTNDGRGGGIKDTTVVLQRLDAPNEGYTVAVNTNENGDYTFRDVPPGQYQVVVYHGYDKLPNPNSSDVLYSTGSTQELLTKGGKAPPLSSIASPKQDSTGNDFVNESTMINTNFSGDWKVNTFNIGPVKTTGFGDKLQQGVTFADPDPATGEGKNLITALDGGTFGSYPPGTTVDTRPASAPYPEMGSQFTYTSGAPNAGQYNVTNTRLWRSDADGSGNWWNMADHTAGNETGRFAMVNGDKNGQVVLSVTADVEPSSSYLVSIWLANLMKLAGFGGGQNPWNEFKKPQLKFVITDDKGAQLYDRSLGQVMIADIHESEWKQFGDIIKTKADSNKLTINLVSTGEEGDGNDYAIDDLSLQKVNLPSGLAMKKASNKTEVALGDTITYTITMKNTFARDLLNVKLQDALPPELEFVEKTVKIKGTPHEDYNPNTGFTVADKITPGEEYTVTFDAKVIKDPSPNSIVNTATATYAYNYIAENTPTTQTETGSSDPVKVAKNADIAMSVKVDKDNPRPGEEISYTITNRNNGPSTAEAPVLKYTPPANLTNVKYSYDGNTFIDWPGELKLDDIPSGQEKNVIIKGTVNVSDDWMVHNHFEIKGDTTDPISTNDFFDYGTTILPVAERRLCRRRRTVIL